MAHSRSQLIHTCTHRYMKKKWKKKGGNDAAKGKEELKKGCKEEGGGAGKGKRKKIEGERRPDPR